MSEIRSHATPARDELAEAGLIDAIAEKLEYRPFRQHAGAAAAGMMKSQGWPKPRTVNSAAELDALPVNACGVDAGEHYRVRHSESRHYSCDRTEVEWSTKNMWEEINLAGPGTFTVLFTPGGAG